MSRSVTDIRCSLLNLNWDPRGRYLELGGSQLDQHLKIPSKCHNVSESVTYRMCDELRLMKQDDYF
jgi:hypothetical protein